MTLKAPASQTVVTDEVALRDMPDKDASGKETLISEFDLKPPGPKHIWCWCADRTPFGPTRAALLSVNSADATALHAALCR